ncbi:unnamed protein product [marine sediment metagenome]|uniref:Uncharacterized protein n=1 Tax=marine sediment metagenome TaxID=412755 RepID=X1GCS3_9ZZZZ
MKEEYVTAPDSIFYKKKCLTCGEQATRTEIVGLCTAYYCDKHSYKGEPGEGVE